METEIKNVKKELENSKAVLCKKSENDDALIAALKQDLRGCRRELERAQLEAGIREETKENLDNSHSHAHEIETVESIADVGKRPNGEGAGESEVRGEPTAFPVEGFGIEGRRVNRHAAEPAQGGGGPQVGQAGGRHSRARDAKRALVQGIELRLLGEIKRG